MKKILLVIIAITFIIATGCQDRTELTAPVAKNPNLGSVNFTKLVSIGNSITAGYQSGSLFASAQEYSFGNILAKQVGASYVQPLYSDPGSAGRIEVVSLTPFVTKTNTTSGSPINLTYQLPYNNLGVPGAALYDILVAKNSQTSVTGNNPFFDLVLRNIGTEYQQAKMLQPTFITFWIGNNDVLGYATSGGKSPYTTAAVFDPLYRLTADSIASIGAKVAVASVMDVTVIPFFNTVGPQLAMGVAFTKLGLPGLFYAKHNEATGTLADSLSLLTGKVLITLKASAYTAYLGLPSGKFYKDNNVTALPVGVDTTKPFGMHPQNPIPDALVLDADEIVLARGLTQSYNTTIKTVAEEKGFVYVDVNAALLAIRAKDFTGGTIINGIKFKTTFVEGGIFSLDGVHPTSQGAAIITNEFIKAINTKYTTSIPLVDVSTIPASLTFGKKVSGYKDLSKYFDINAFKDLRF